MRRCVCAADIVSGVPKRHDNLRVSRFLAGYLSAGELCADYAAVADILKGSLMLKTEGNTATRPLSRQVLFHILQQCPSIDVSSLAAATNGRYAYRSLAGYAALARVASKALEAFIDKLPAAARLKSVAEQRRAIDGPYMIKLQSLGLA